MPPPPPNNNPQAPPAWYPCGTGEERWWDGGQWNDRYRGRVTDSSVGWYVNSGWLDYFDGVRWDTVRSKPLGDIDELEPHLVHAPPPALDQARSARPYLPPATPQGHVTVPKAKAPGYFSLATPGGRRHYRFLILGVWVVPILGLITYCSVSADSGGSGNSGAIVACEQQVEASLKSPSSAKFHDVAATGGPTTYTVRGTVDAENSFGASLRSSFQCTVEDRGSSMGVRVDYIN